MALVECPECSKKISDQAPACPKCGCPQKSPPEKNENTAAVYAGVGCSDKSGAEPLRASKGSEPVKVERAGAQFERIGFGIIILSMGGCSVGMVASNGGTAPFVLGGIGFFVGLVIFIYGRF